VRHHYRDIASAIASIKQQFGRLGILVNNAAPPRGGDEQKAVSDCLLLFAVDQLHR